MRLSKHDDVSVAVLDEDEFDSPSLLEDAVERLIEYSEHKTLVINLSRVQSLTSIGVAILVAAQGLALIHDTRLSFACIQPRVRHLLEQIGVNRVLSLHDTVKDAILALHGQRGHS